MVSNKNLLVFCLLIGCTIADQKYDISASELVSDVYNGCLQHFQFNCVKPKALAWISNVYENKVIRITDDLAIRKTGEISTSEQEQRSNKVDAFEILDKVEDFLATHELQIKIPTALRPEGELGAFVPRSLTPEDFSVPLSSEEEGRSRKKHGLMRKVIIPFLLGLKFKTGVLVPLGLALIALKTWKAMTLGLLSLVLSGALVIFKFTKPKIVNYEVIHYPHHVDHHVDHIEPAAPGWDHPGYARSMEDVAQNLAYRGYDN
ncbi:uncharacterized protein LOC123291135 [Chrysoperla carnea]|uniref:uncharacterized protein LOC123291135 n=1 Tax=Chrysoperla carnea TaxID=189513 RepID=UPI001D089668|nr:uncharacterized protein LOC123291135 [Chrysoperla carnea]